MKPTKEYAIFYCKADKNWAVMVRPYPTLPSDIWVEIANCPDEHTARVILEGMYKQENQK